MATKTLRTPEVDQAQPATSVKPKGARKGHGNLIVAAAGLLPLGVWLSAGSLNRLATPFSGIRQVAVLAAYAAVTMMALNIALCARHPAVVKLFGGMGQLFKTHMMVGKLAFSLVVVHGLLMVSSFALFSPLAGLSLLTPAAGWAVFAGVLAFTVLTVSVIGRIKGGAAGALHKLVGLSFLLATVHYLSVPGLKVLSPVVGPYLAIAAAVGVTGYAYHLLSGRKKVSSSASRQVKSNRPAVEEAAEVARRAEVKSSAG